jgi:hypothetical protein
MPQSSTTNFSAIFNVVGVTVFLSTPYLTLKRLLGCTQRLHIMTATMKTTMATNTLHPRSCLGNTSPKVL